MERRLERRRPRRRLGPASFRAPGVATWRRHGAAASLPPGPASCPSQRHSSDVSADDVFRYGLNPSGARLTIRAGHLTTGGFRWTSRRQTSLDRFRSHFVL